ncbi:hypothetical protein AUG19_08880 [archaeon 13_1_20CM_2_54_9]|nr:MAG: hypothetical protein AUJ07_07055 [Crenarchaeota archaeon 13_1_40CM_3_53_5]OLE74383.1 MAG: hypothetical protein AUG19_08880 [archaeon 13_1_20CM_2_54_9]TMI28558.1 MAG: hypothetical protein E6H36_00500 [Candidatus Bathyarchaeota archaeon]TMI29774.1 MAG: hypothetical protein E6H29_10850 [Candidatus Bathyarchaeota archaeon]
MSEEFEERFIKPIINASYPGTLAGLGLAALSVTGARSLILTLSLASGALLFLLSAFFLFFYTVYPTRRRYWTGSALSFLMGLVASIVSVIILVIVSF